MLRAQEHGFLVAEGQEACMLDVLTDYTGECVAVDVSFRGVGKTDLVQSMLNRRCSLHDRQIQATKSREKVQ